MAKNTYTGNVLDSQAREQLKGTGQLDLQGQRQELAKDQAANTELERQFREMQLLMQERKRERERARETKEKTERLQNEV